VPTIFAAHESRVLINGQPIDGVRSLEYRRVQPRESIYGLGSAERIGIVSGGMVVEGRLTVASTAPALDAVSPAEAFQLSAVLVHGDSQMNVSFEECYMSEKSFELGVGGHGESVYSFTATRAREERG
jgi:hypothetical protein